MRCDLCGQQVKNDVDTKFLPLYVSGSEGIYACVDCRIILTDIARGLRSVATKNYLAGQKKSRKNEN